jgi:hypothetical protein
LTESPAGETVEKSWTDGFGYTLGNKTLPKSPHRTYCLTTGKGSRVVVVVGGDDDKVLDIKG